MVFAGVGNYQIQVALVEGGRRVGGDAMMKQTWQCWDFWKKSRSQEIYYSQKNKGSKFFLRICNASPTDIVISSQ